MDRQDALDLGSFDCDLHTGVLDWDPRLIAMFGFVDDPQLDRSVAAFNRRIHPDDLEMVTQAMTDAAATLGPLQAVFRIALPGGRLRWLQLCGRAVAGPEGSAGRLVGVVVDLTDAHDKETRAEEILESMPVGFVRFDANWTYTYVNAEAERLTRANRTQMLGASLWELFPATRGEPFEPLYRRVVATGVTETIEAYYPEPMNSWFEVRVVAEPGGGVSQYFLDVGERRRAQQLLQLSADVGERLVAASDVSSAAAAMPRSVVPLLADWSFVTLQDSNGAIREVRTQHRNANQQLLLDEFAAHCLDDGGVGIMREVLATQQPRWLDAAEIRAVRARYPSARARAALTALAPAVIVVYPLQSATGSLGALVFGRGPERVPLTSQERALMATICRRAGLALDNARLYEGLAAAAEHDRGVAAELQRALLTDLPQPDDLELVSRYRTAVDPDQVGGDWVDALVQPDGALTVMVGDVEGHDIRAAASMGQLRGMLRTFAWLEDAPPSQLLTQLDRAARDLHVGVTATALVARIEQTPAEAASGVRTVYWSSAGHPPPVVLHPDGTTEVLDPAGGNDVLLGVAPEFVRTDHTWTAQSQTTLFLYTDGLVETRQATIDAGISDLRDSLTRHHELGLDALVDAVLADLLGERHEDDTALLAIRFHRQDLQ